jgi:hypothetical protein
MTFYNVILPPLLGLLAGIAGAFITPLVSWGIEKKRMKVQRRRELIANWHALLHDISQGRVANLEDTQFYIFRDCTFGHQHFPSLQPFLRTETLRLVEQLGGSFGWDDNIQAAYDALVQDVNTTDQRWDLV